MTTDNGATAVVTEETEVTPPSQDESAQIGTDTAEAVPATDAAPSEPTAEAEADDSFDADKFIAAKLGTSTEEPAKPAPQYGKTAAEVELAQFNQLRTSMNALLRDGDRDVQDYIRNQLGLEPEMSDKLWKEKVRPLIQAAANMPQIAVNQLFTEDLQRALPEADFKRLWESGKQYADRSAVLKQYGADVEARVNQDWESKKGKEWVPVKVFKEGIEEAVTKAQARFERQRNEGTYQSGQSATGRTRDTRSEDDILLDPATPMETINKILARRNGQ